mgnify:FL=1
MKKVATTADAKDVSIVNWPATKPTGDITTDDTVTAALGKLESKTDKLKDYSKVSKVSINGVDCIITGEAAEATIDGSDITVSDTDTATIESALKNRVSVIEATDTSLETSDNTVGNVKTT